LTDSGFKDIEALISRMRGAGEAFAIATVIRTVAPTSAKPGMKAVVTSSGDLSAGWLGGGCVTSAVKKAAIEAIGEGAPKLVILRPEDLLKDAEEEKTENHIMVARNGCPSKGSLDIFVEPYLPHAAEIIVFGSSPVAFALCEIAEKFNYSVISKTSDENPDTGKTIPNTAGEGDKSTAATHEDRPRFIVLATQGKGDLKALREALQIPATYIGFVASKKKFSTLRGKLKNDGISDAQLDKVKAPAGLDIGSITPEEIALSILAEIIQFNRS
jgi:xanthine dehydrogenase accessory factor